MWASGRFTQPFGHLGLTVTGTSPRAHHCDLAVSQPLTLSLIVNKKGRPPLSQALNHVSRSHNCTRSKRQVPGLQASTWQGLLSGLYQGNSMCGHGAADAPRRYWGEAGGGGDSSLRRQNSLEESLSWGFPLGKPHMGMRAGLVSVTCCRLRPGPGLSWEPLCSTVCLLGWQTEPWSHAAQTLGPRRPHSVLCRGFSKAWVPVLHCGHL